MTWAKTAINQRANTDWDFRDVYDLFILWAPCVYNVISNPIIKVFKNNTNVSRSNLFEFVKITLARP